MQEGQTEVLLAESWNLPLLWARSGQEEESDVLTHGRVGQGSE